MTGTDLERDRYLSGRVIPPGGVAYVRGEPVVVAYHWEAFLRWMRKNWQPGQHIANIGPTGEGKTTLNVGLLGIRKYVLALDPKGGDETLSASGWLRVGHLEPRIGPTQIGKRLRHSDRVCEDCRTWRGIWEGIEAGRPARLIVGSPARNRDEDAALRKLLHETLQFVRYSKGWTVYVDEFEVLASQQMFGLGSPVSQMLNTARSSRTSVVTSFQAAAWVPKHSTRQARLAVMYSTGSRQMIKNVAEDMGRDWRQLAEAVDELPQFYCLVIPRGKNGGPMMLVSAPKVI